MSEILVVSSFPDRERARQIGTALIGKQLAACVNLLPSVESIYLWEGKIEDAQETLAFISTTSARYAEVEAEIRAQHPYDVPKIIAIEISSGLPEYLGWIGDACRQDGR